LCFDIVHPFIAEQDMDEATPLPITDLLQSVRSLQELEGPQQARLFEAVYQELRRLAGALLQRRDGTLTPTVLVHEAYLRLSSGAEVAWENRAHFLGIAARAMRQVLVDHARARSAAKRGGGLRRVTLDSKLGIQGGAELELLDLNRALDRLAAKDHRMSQVVELRIFAGLTMKEVSHVLGVSKRTADGDWAIARLWLARELEGRAA
jgi:RNA polymerase sigma factor (TIGR02999 family)